MVTIQAPESSVLICCPQANVVGMVDATVQPGVILGGMEKATPQARSFLQRGDVITAVDGYPLRGRRSDVPTLVNAITCAPLPIADPSLLPLRGCNQCCGWLNPQKQTQQHALPGQRDHVRMHVA